MNRSKMLRNFDWSVQLMPQYFYTPQTEHKVLEIMNHHTGETIRCIGRLRSWNDILDSKEIILDLKQLCSMTTGIDNAESHAVVFAGCEIVKLINDLMQRRPWTMPSLAFITELIIG